MRKNIVPFLIAAFMSVASMSVAQTGGVKGFVYDKSSGEPMILTTVYLEGTSVGGQTDLNGFFNLVQVPTGAYVLTSTSLGYDTARLNIVINNGESVTKKLFISASAKMLKGVQVNSRKTARQTQVNVGVYSITPKEIKLLPSAGGEPDIAQFLQVTPGVIFTGDQGGQLYIRGGNPSQTGILLDGVTIYNPFHSIGLYSVFETDAIRSADVYTAGFGAQYGNRTSAILDIRTKDGNKNRLSGKLSASPIMGRFMLEGPLSKAKVEGGSDITFLLTAKHSYLDKTSTGLYSGLGEPFETGLPYSFTDLYGKVTFNAANGSKLNIFGFNFDDKASVLEEGTGITQADFGWRATGAGATFVINPGNSSALLSGKFAYSNYQMDFNEAHTAPRTSGIQGFEAGMDITYFLKNSSKLSMGLEVSGQYSELSYLNSFKAVTELERRNTSAAFYMNYRKNIANKLIIEPGLRIQYYSSISYLSPEPRLGLKYNVSPNVRLKAATGWYSQNIVSTKSDKDIVNFFTGFMLSPDQELTTPSGEEAKANVMKAYHLAGGIEVDIQRVEVTLEPWYKYFGQNIELNRYKQAVSDKDFIIETGKAFGIDLSAKYDYKKWYLWGVASYQKVTRYDGLQTYPTPFDRRMNFNLVAAYTTGNKKDWEISGRFNYGSPFPFTQTQGFYENLSFNQNGIGTNYLQQNGNIGILYAEDINGGRLSNYHRLDLSVKKRFDLSKNSNLDAMFSLTNVYNRNNVFYVSRIVNKVYYQLPIFPSLSLSWNF